MKRREFLVSAGSVGLAAASVVSSATDVSAAENTRRVLQQRPRQNAKKESAQRELTEVRTYTAANGEKKEKLISMLETAMIPALNRLGISPVGLFTASEGDFANKVLVVIPYKTITAFMNTPEQLTADDVYMKSAGAIFDGGSKDPIYTALETSLLHNFATTPKLEKRDLGADRVFEFRIYRSCNVERNRAKIAMFEEGGELNLFREKGLNPIFFGNTISGNLMPSMSYMIAAPNRDALAAAWKSFVEAPEWDKLKKDPAYSDTATEIFKFVLAPTAGSQI
ncbi:MAG: NIPSNAP family protein [Thermoguttaceae bacterium]